MHHCDHSAASKELLNEGQLKSWQSVAGSAIYYSVPAALLFRPMTCETF